MRSQNSLQKESKAGKEAESKVMEAHNVNLSGGAIIAGILVIVLLMAIPLLLFPDSEFGGSDGAGSETVARIAPTYDTEWVTNLWAPPGSETESMLFALQAALGGILIGYFFGYMRGGGKGARGESTVTRRIAQQDNRELTDASR